VTRSDRKADRPDVEIGARARAKRLRFKRTPVVDVKFWGDPEIDTETTRERENLPNEAEAGITYRDVEVRWRARARIIGPHEERPPPEE
jgi:hypothetical protein